MKKQNLLKFFVTMPLGFSLFVGLFSMFLPTMVALAAGTCYINTGALSVSPTTHVCSVDASGRTSYADISGNNIAEPVAGKCYAGTEAGSGSFTTISYKEFRCADLETLRINGLKDRCTASGGTAKDVPASSTNNFTAGISCVCVAPQVYLNFICSDPAPATTTAPATTDSPKVTSSKCDPTSAEAATNKCCLASDLNSDNCGIIAYLNIAFNFVSGGVTLAIIGNIVLAGIQYSTAQGDPSAVGKSKKRIRDAIIAFIMFLSLYAFIQWLIPGGVF
jgi:hypothetical protein